MGMISREFHNIGWNIGSEIKNATDNISDMWRRVTGGVKATWNSIMNYDVVGINYAKVPDMQRAIDEYVKALSTHLEEVKRDADNAKAMKGEYAEAIKEFINAVCDSCDAVISYLNKFRDKLATGYAESGYSEDETVLGSYKAKDTNLASDINDQAGDLRKNHERYGAGGGGQ
ncbi:MAG: hypothetical protein IJ193_02285 [Bacilli bacterium]|nr:hypothetical protein [Bacilli bacterium]